MKYQVWTKKEYSDGWLLAECDGQDEVKEAELKELNPETEIRVTRELLWGISVNLEDKEPPAKPAKPEQGISVNWPKEEESVETVESGPEKDKGPRGKGNCQVR